MLSIRLKRMGTKKRPYYRVVVSDSRKRPTGRALAEIGTYHPGEEPALVKLDKEQVQAWLARGARPSDTVKSLIARS